MQTALTVEQSLVDNYLARAQRFSDNVDSLEQQIKGMLDTVKNRFMPSSEQMSTHQEPKISKPEQAVITANDIDIDTLLKGMDIEGMSL